MIKKTSEIKQFVELVRETFGKDGPAIQDHWEGNFKAIGFQKDDKLIYVAIYGKQDYFYECELLLDDPEEVYIPQESENGVSAERVLEVMNKFFNIK
jgi:hypothetical protein